MQQMKKYIVGTMKIAQSARAKGVTGYFAKCVIYEGLIVFTYMEYQLTHCKYRTLLLFPKKLLLA
jgi:hypothetical protein